MRSGFLFICFLSVCAVRVFAQRVLYAGSYTKGLPGKGIMRMEFDTLSGKLGITGAKDSIVNPSFLCMSHTKTVLYACTESKMKNAGSVSAFVAGRNGLTALSKVNTNFENPVYLTLSPDDKYLFAVTYGQAALLVFPLGGRGEIMPAGQTFTFAGSGPVQSRQDASHPHCAVFSPDGKFLYVCDLGADRIRVFRYHPNRNFVLIPYDDLAVHCIPGSGPRHLRFHPSGRFAYCTEELSGCVTVYSYENGTLNFLQRLSSYKMPSAEYATSDLSLSPDGNDLYVCNRGENTVAHFRVDPLSGKLSLSGHADCGGDLPRSVLPDLSGKFLLIANQGSGTLDVLGRDPSSGKLRTIKQKIKFPGVSSLVFE